MRICDTLPLVASPPVVYEQTEWVDAETAEREP